MLADVGAVVGKGAGTVVPMAFIDASLSVSLWIAVGAARWHSYKRIGSKTSPTNDL